MLSEFTYMSEEKKRIRKISILISSYLKNSMNLYKAVFPMNLYGALKIAVLLICMVVILRCS